MLNKDEYVLMDKCILKLEKLTTSSIMHDKIQDVINDLVMLRDGNLLSKKTYGKFHTK